jgi:hypothetical protein
MWQDESGGGEQFLGVRVLLFAQILRGGGAFDGLASVEHDVCVRS